MQVRRFAAHVVAQEPMEQTCPAGQARPHAPQFELSVSSSAQSVAPESPTPPSPLLLHAV